MFMKIGALTLFLSSITILEAKDCGPKFNGRCSCGNITYEGVYQFVVNCTNEGFTNTDILKNLPIEIQVLIFTGNNVSVVPWNVFGQTKALDNLRVVDMSNNFIKEIKGKTYHNVASVQRLILNHNELVISSNDEGNRHHPRMFSNFDNLLELHLTNAFADNTDEALADDLHDTFVNSNLKKLYKLHLEQNEIRTFRDERVFCNLPQLHDLHLSNNHLTGIRFNITCLKNLRFLDLRENEISTLTKHEVTMLDKTYDKVRNKQTFGIDLRGNPFSCDCALVDFALWLNSTNVTVRNVDELRCCSANHKELRNQIKKVKFGSCFGTDRQASSVHSKKKKVSTGIIIFLSITIVCSAILLIYVTRYRMRTKLTPLIEAVTKKVQYTTIRNRDNIEDI